MEEEEHKNYIDKDVTATMKIEFQFKNEFKFYFLNRVN